MPTREQIATLGGWDVAQGVLLIDQDNNQHELQPGEIVELKPGMGFAKKVRFRRGSVLQARIEQELALLRRHHPSLEYVATGHWIRIPAHPMGPNWNPA